MMRWGTADRLTQRKECLPNPRRHRGAAMAEFVVVLPALLLLGLGSIQSALFYQAKTTATYATFEAARKGATNHAVKAPMLDEFGMRLAPIFGGDGSAGKALDAMRKGKTEANDPTITQIDIINPSQEAFQEFGAANPDNGKTEIPNVHLKYRDASNIGASSGVNIQDANLLKIKTTYGFPLKIPLVNTVLSAALKQIDPDNASFYDQNRIPITAVATVRMQSEAWENGNLKADGSPPGDGTVPNGDPGTSNPPNGDDPTNGQGGDPLEPNPTCGNGNPQITCIDPGNNGSPTCPVSGEAAASSQTALKPNLPDRGLGNPINVISGNKYQLETDFPALPGPLGLVWQRHYNSQSQSRSQLGAGWRHSYDVKATPTNDGFRVVQADGRAMLFQDAGNGRYESTLKSDGWLTLAADDPERGGERPTWHWRSGQQLQFNARGQLTDIRLPSGEAVRLQYNDQHRLFLVRDAQNRELNLGYYPNGRLKTVLDTTGQALRYRYDDRGNLESVTYADDTQRTYHYEDKNNPNNLTGLTDQRGIRFATWAYDDNDRAISSEHADGVEKVTLAYNDDGTRLVTNSLGEASTYYTETRQGLGIVTSIAGPGCSSCSAGDVQYEYDEQLQLIRTTAKDGTATVREYDAQGRTTVLSQVLANGQLRELARYDYADDTTTTPSRIRKPSVNSDASHEFALSYNAAGQMTEVVERGWSPTAGGKFEQTQRQTQLTYEHSLLTRIDGPRDDVDDITTLKYDKKKRLTRFTTPDGRHLSITAYDRYGRPTEIRQGEQQPMVMAYNHRGDVTAVTQRGQTLHYHYNAAGNLTEVTGLDGETLELTYDDAGRATKVLGPDGRQMISDLDSEGRTTGNQLLSGQGEVLAQLSYFYDAEGRLSEIQRNGETARSMEYDGEKVTGVTDAKGNRTGFEYSSLGELLAITQPDGNATRLAYDAKQQLAEVTDARNNATRYRSNDFGQVTEQRSPDTGTTRFGYDAAGNQTRKTDATGATTDYTYDAANRLTQRRSSDRVTQLRYDPATGRLSKVSDAATTETFAYNLDAQLTEHTRRIDKLSFTTTYAYSAQGKLVSKQLPDDQRLDYHYHNTGPRKGSLRAITRDDVIGKTTVIGELNTADPTTNTHRFVHGNGIITEYRYDNDGRLTQIDRSSGDALAYRYDEVGRIVGIDRDGGLEKYRYDALGRLTGADTLSGKYRYRYDTLGNRTEQTENGKTTTYTYGAKGKGNRLLVSGDGGALEQKKQNKRKTGRKNETTYTYNPAGSPTAIGKRTYTYNVEQRPTKLYIDGKLAAKYVYNGFGERIKKVAYKNSEQPKVTYYFYDGHQLTTEANENGTITAQYIYLEHQPVAKLKDRDIYALHTDHLGTPQAATDEDGEIVWTAEYTPFGKANISTEDITLNLRFPGQYEDSESGTYYNYFRDYDPKMGRYLTSDPIGLHGGLNTYVYVFSNPISQIDLLGLEVLVGQHPAFVNSQRNPFQHAAIVLRPDNPRDFANHPLFQHSNGREATLGGQAFGEGGGIFGRLVSAFNFPGDHPSGLQDLSAVAVCGPASQSADTEFILKLIQIAESYNNRALYDPFPDPFGFTFNSNSYVSGILIAAGVIPPSLPGTRPGYNRPLPIDRYRK